MVCMTSVLRLLTIRVYKVQSMEESWVLPYDADLERLRTQHEKIVQCHHRLQERYDAMVCNKVDLFLSYNLGIRRETENGKGAVGKGVHHSAD